MTRGAEGVVERAVEAELGAEAVVAVAEGKAAAGPAVWAAKVDPAVWPGAGDQADKEAQVVPAEPGEQAV